MDQEEKIKELNVHIANAVLEKYKKEKIEAESKYQTTISTFEQQYDFPRLLSFVKEHFKNDFKEQRALLKTLFQNTFEGYDVYDRDDCVVAKKDDFKIVIMTNTYQKAISFIYRGVPEPYLSKNEVYYDTEGNKTPFWEAYKNYIESPDLKKLVKASKYNIAKREGNINKLFGYIKSFRQLQDEELKANFVNVEKEILDSRVKHSALNEDYLLGQLNAETLLKSHACLIESLISEGWTIIVNGIAKYNSYYFNGNFEDKGDVNEN